MIKENMKKKKMSHEEMLKHRREKHKKTPQIRMYSGAKQRAKKNNLEFGLKSYKDLPPTPSFCPILGIPIFVKEGSKNGGSDNSPSLDRIDNTKGYVKNNIHIISRKANQMKSNANFEEIKMLYKFMKKYKERRSDGKHDGYAKNVK